MRRSEIVSVAPSQIERLSDSMTPDRTWACTVWDDPVNLMSYVTYVFMTYFHFSQARAEQLMLTVHTQGRAAVASGGREEMERHVTAMHSYGLWATVTRD